MKKQILLTILLTLLLPTSTLLAISEKDKQAVLRNYEYYDPNSSEACDAGTGTGSFTPVPDNVVQGAQTNRATYEEAAAQVDIPWEMLATIHYRETRFDGTQNPGNGQGVYQWYAEEGDYPAGPISQAEFLRQTIKLAEELKDDFGQRGTSGQLSYLNQPLNRGSSPEKIKNTFFSYNGRAGVYIEQAQRLGFNPLTEPWEGSPYVMNKATALQSPSNPEWGQVKSDAGSVEFPANEDFGAWPIYAAISGFSCDNPTNSDVVAIAKAELDKGVKEEPDGSNRGPEVDKYNFGLGQPWGASFVSWVYLEAGDPFTGGVGQDWLLPEGLAIESWFISQSRHFPNDPYQTEGIATDRVQPGDVVFLQDPLARPDPATNVTPINVGIVSNVEGDNIRVIEGDTGNTIRETIKVNYRSDPSILGFGSQDGSSDGGEDALE